MKLLILLKNKFYKKFYHFVSFYEYLHILLLRKANTESFLIIIYADIHKMTQNDKFFYKIHF